MLLAVPEPYDFVLSTSRYRDYGSDGATVWHDGGLHRVVERVEVRLAPAPGGVEVAPASEAGALEAARLLGLAFDLEAFHRWASEQEVLGPLADSLRGFRPTLNPRPFEALVIAITAQQISLRAAAAIRGRFVQAFGRRYEQAWEFPVPERVARLRPEHLTALGFSQRKAEYVLTLARAELDYGALSSLPDEDVVAAITSLPGLGRWTADWYLARHLARPEAWPAGDLGLRKAISTFYADGRPLTAQEVRAMGSRFAPFQNLSAQFLLLALKLAG